MNEQQIRQLIQQEIQKSSSLSRFNVSNTQRHRHNNIDSPATFQPTFTYIGEVSSTGTRLLLPNGWTSSKGGTGTYTVTHNLNSTLYEVVANITTFIGVFATVTARNLNSFTVETFVPSGGSYANTDASFGFMLTIANNSSTYTPIYRTA